MMLFAFMLRGFFSSDSFSPFKSNQHLWKDVCRIVNVGVVIMSVQLSLPNELSTSAIYLFLFI